AGECRRRSWQLRLRHSPGSYGLDRNQAAFHNYSRLVRETCWGMVCGIMTCGLAQLSELYHLPGFHEPFSAISHLLGAVVFFLLGLLLLQRGRGNRTRLIYLSVFVASYVFLFSMSGVYHMMVRGGTAHRVMERLDHGAIFVLIAGTFTPAHGL